MFVYWNRGVITRLATLLIATLVLGACNDPRPAGQGFSLPEGNADAGKDVYLSLQCNGCHSLPGIPRSADSSSKVSVMLGGEVRKIKTYEELVTAVINPSHRILQAFAPQHRAGENQSAMRNYNDVMTVTQLIDLVSFLQTQYHLKPFERSQYRAYFPATQGK